MLDDVAAIATAKDLSFTGATSQEIAAAYRVAVSLGSNVGKLELDRRGWDGASAGGAVK